MRQTFNLHSMLKLLTISFLLIFFSCKNRRSVTGKASNNPMQVNAVNPSFFAKNSDALRIETIDCTLSHGEVSKCLKITTKGFSPNHKMGPWCPETINDGKDKGGIWFKDGKMYDVDGAFIQNVAKLYGDDKWMMYDDNGKVLKTTTKEQCQKLAGAQLLDEFTNYCIECLPQYVADLTKTYTFPLQPVLLENPISLARPPRGGKGNGGKRPPGPPPGGGKGRRGPSIRGIALNGIAFDAPAPVNLILSGYTIPPLDDAGGHVNMDAGYHYHATTGMTTQIEQPDGHAPMIGYAMDGIALYANKNSDGKEPKDLDECRGHFDEVRGYHYHVNQAGANSFIPCFSGAIAN